MKKLALTIFAALIFFSVSAQTSTSFGLRVTPMFNWISPLDTSTIYSYENAETKIGIGFGPSMRYSFSENFNVDISGIFTWQEFALTQRNLLTSADIRVVEEFKVQYLNVPLNLNGQFNIVGDLKALINFGMGLSINIKQLRSITADGFTSDYVKVRMLNFMDIFLSAGLGTAYSFRDNLHLSLTAQYNNGIIDGWFDRKNDPPSTIDELSLKHRNITLNIGFYIDF
jgi:long-subunit fatty acid transport protein